MCGAHRRRALRLRRGLGRRPLAEPVPDGFTPLERVIVSGSLFLEAETDDEYARALERFRNACRSWMKSQGWKPPAAFEDASADHGAGAA